AGACATEARNRWTSTRPRSPPATSTSAACCRAHEAMPRACSALWKPPWEYPASISPSSDSEQRQLFLNALQVHQAYAQADQPHRLVAPGESLAEQQPVAVRIPAGAGLLQGGLGEVVELEFHEGLADPVAAVQARQPALQLVVQRRQFGQAGGQVRQILVEGGFHAQRLAAAVHLHRALIDAARQLPEPFAEAAELAQQCQ